ncbi:hypothetical protein AUEXF2481DRAFT_8503 [Aureobasidium subglaciale EXF-2481]|uniref:RING-type domain-containing protein n=1 Tax=Aureobasidium subglaciale (strain EXF-2481) TaxID=1043005 RepID=A0A074Y0V1_AURSE|nr:uncharacterized protein AUEXF2481DRAFT_8503 [Aureobasidium subglaciale EXF-2481]KAI5202959.1 hypothetical protein E4T38_05365 [Aureobasidium subglaciale]KAI5221842.1 hypothetical protein E4T40_05298 [Aureobasidium subglaciale]KAI5225847.1 hypothetical protein E4T41_05117 [Aureobasidium subglaciale]KAI5261643.1 hypothetical protein E4T46_05010 [Aureobasidium subglaciale]KEQ91433.1 hypothetical protein AUEXF2481DRAFT_8503 [Aureobasidium subglaciale EXF-2481]
MSTGAWVQRSKKKMSNKKHFEKYEQGSLRVALAEDDEYRHCFSTTCDAGQLHHGGVDQPIFTCQSCQHKNCVACEIDWHVDETCDQYQARRRTERGEEDERSRAEMEKISKECPECHAPIEKNDGCDHMTCSKCRHEFCWLCFVDYRNVRREGNQLYNKSCLYYYPILREAEDEFLVAEDPEDELGFLQELEAAARIAGQNEDA